MTESRYIKYDRRGALSHKRSIPVPGADEQAGKFFRCWNCGYTCNTDRDKLGDGVGYHATDQILGDVFANGRTSKDNTLSISLTTDVSIIEVDSNSDPKVFKTNFSQITFSGCPLCGSRNYK